MPSWEHFKELCNLRFGPVVHNTRLSELAHMPFTSMVQDYSDRFNVVLCYARNLSAQKAELFVGGLLEHIKVDEELREPQDLQMAMHLARAFERHANAMMPAIVQCGAWPQQRPGLPAAPWLPQLLQRARALLCHQQQQARQPLPGHSAAYRQLNN
jgi:hypothetical protein